METMDHRKLLDDFQRYYELQPPPPSKHNLDLPEFWAIMELDRLAHEQPGTAWLLVLELLKRPLTDTGFGCLAAGPVEDLIQYHGPEVIAWIEAEALSNPMFRELLGGVWESGTPEIWERVERVRGEAW